MNLQESFFEIFLVLQVTVAVNVGNFKVKRQEMPAHQNGSMASDRVFLGTHQGNAMILRSFDDALQSLLE
jgi:superfamily II helicase